MVCHHQVPGHCQLLTEARSPKDHLSAGQSISGPTTNLTLIPVYDVLTLSVPAAFWLSLQPQPIGSSDGRKKEEELSGHTGRASKRQRVGRYFSRCSDSRWSWFMRRGLHVHASVSSASYYLRSWLVDGLGHDQPRLQGNLMSRKDWIYSFQKLRAQRG